MRRAALALTRLLPSLDATPLLNLTAGCIRPPGSVHRGGGVQQLLTPPGEARRAAAALNPPAVWARLLDALAPHVPPDDPAGPDRPGAVPPDPAGGGVVRGLSGRMTGIARTGVHTYHSGSEARLAVLTACAGAGWALRDVLRHLESGAWPGLASFYARYRPAHRPGAIGRDWRKAAAHAARDTTIRKNHTSGPAPHPAQLDRGTRGDHSGGSPVRPVLAERADRAGDQPVRRQPPRAG